MEENIFITEIKINKLRHLHDIVIPVVKEDEPMKHLILTGKNGSGKTSLLEDIAGLLQFSVYSKFVNNQKEPKKNKSIFDITKNTTQITFNKNNLNIHQEYVHGYFFTAFFEAKRRFNLLPVSAVEKVDTPQMSSIETATNQNFLKYLVFLRSKLTDASYRNDKFEKTKLEKWFYDFEKSLKDIFKDEQIHLRYDSNYLTFDIIQSEKSLFGFQSLSDGYASFLNILTELMMRMENKKADAYDLNGIVLIDEIETHLHIELQKSILPFLTAFFPKVQFIVTTHSPFILSSIENAVIYDLENKLLVEDASEISYSALVQNYFLVNSEYSTLMEKKMNDFERLTATENRSENEDEKLADLLMDLKTLSPLLSPEMKARFNQAQRKILKSSSAKA